MQDCISNCKATTQGKKCNCTDAKYFGITPLNICDTDFESKYKIHVDAAWPPLFQYWGILVPKNLLQQDWISSIAKVPYCLSLNWMEKPSLAKRKNRWNGKGYIKLKKLTRFQNAMSLFLFFLRNVCHAGQLKLFPWDFRLHKHLSAALQVSNRYLLLNMIHFTSLNLSYHHWD